jgi:hypothetical protein
MTKAVLLHHVLPVNVLKQRCPCSQDEPGPAHKHTANNTWSMVQQASTLCAVIYA